MSDDTTQTTADDKPVNVPDMTSRIGRAFVAIQKSLTTEMTDASAATDKSYADALDKLSGLPDMPGIAAARAAIEVERDAARGTASDARAAAIRAEYPEVFAFFATYGLPKNVKPVKSNSKTNAQPAAVLADASGTRYVKRSVSSLVNGERTYQTTGAIACGECPMSEVVAATYSAPGNLRQAGFRALGRMHTADVAAHSACFDAFRDAEAAFSQTVTVTYYDIAPAS